MAGTTSPVPAPPDRPPDRLPSLETQPLDEAWRIHGATGDPLHPRRHRAGKFRFDAPAGEYPVTYVNLDRHATYAEVFGDAREIPSSAANRRLFRLTTTRPLRVVHLDRGTVLGAFGLDLNVCASRDYPRTRPWSLALHRWYPQADGIRYLGRHAAQELNLCLFLDRCGPALTATEVGKLADLRRDGLIAAHRYHLVPRLLVSVT